MSARPAKDPFYDAECEKEAKEAAEATRKQKEAQTYLKRVIVHPAFHNIDFKEARRLLATMDQGEAIIRPSSQVRRRRASTPPSPSPPPHTLRSDTVHRVVCALLAVC